MVAFFVTEDALKRVQPDVRRGGVTARVRFELGSDLHEGSQDLCARPQGLIRSGGRRLLGPLQADQSHAERLETNTSMPHMIRATSIWSWQAACTDPRQTASGLPFTFTDSPDHAGVSCTIRDMGLRSRPVSHNRKFFS